MFCCFAASNADQRKFIRTQLIASLAGAANSTGTSFTTTEISLFSTKLKEIVAPRAGLDNSAQVSGLRIAASLMSQAVTTGVTDATADVRLHFECCYLVFAIDLLILLATKQAVVNAVGSIILARQQSVAQNTSASTTASEEQQVVDLVSTCGL